MRRRGWDAVATLAILALAGTLIHLMHSTPQPPAQPYYAKPTRYEQENGPPHRVCKWWGGNYSTPPDRVECVTETGGSDED